MKKSTGNLSRSRITGKFGSPAAFVQYCRNAVVRAFDNSFISHMLVKVRETVPYVRNRVVGTFLLTFGIYSALIAAFETVFDFGGSQSDIFIPIVISVAAVPLLISKGTVYTMLSTSRTGRVIGECIGIRLQAMGGATAIGRENIAFLLGMLAGTLTFVADLRYIIGTVIAVVASSLILTYPEATVVFAAALLPFGNTNVFLYISVVGLLAFVIKIIRKKRYLTFPSHVKVALLFVAVVAFLGSASGNIRSAVFALMCMMIAVSDRNGEKAKYASTVALAFCAVITSVYLAFFAVSYLSGMDADFSVFDVSTLSVMSASLIPVAASVMITGEIMPGRTAFFCFSFLTVFLFVTGSYMCLMAAAMGTVLLFLAYRRRLAYLIMSLAGAAYCAWVWLGGSNRVAFDTFMGFLSEFNLEDKQGLSVLEIIYGEGLGRGVFTGDNFYDALVGSMGLVGFVILASALMLLAAYAMRIKKGTSASTDQSYGFLSAFGHFCSLFVLLVCGAQINIWGSDSIFIMFWIMFAASSAVAMGEKVKIEKASEMYSYDGENGVSAEIVVSFDKIK